MRIALFPGHAGKDSGAVDGIATGDKLYTIEAVITANIVSKIALFLRLLGIEHIIASGGWDYRIAATKNCNVGISVHADISISHDVHGYHCIYFPYSSEGKRLAENIDEAMSTVTSRARSVHAENLKILRETSFPVTLIEVGFLSNTIDESLLSNDEHQTHIAFSIVCGLRNFFYTNKH